jgi:hypothetical protein
MSQINTSGIENKFGLLANSLDLAHFPARIPIRQLSGRRVREGVRHSYSAEYDGVHCDNDLTMS